MIDHPCCFPVSECLAEIATRSSCATIKAKLVSCTYVEMIYHHNAHVLDMSQSDLQGDVFWPNSQHEKISHLKVANAQKFQCHGLVAKHVAVLWIHRLGTGDSQSVISSLNYCRLQAFHRILTLFPRALVELAPWICEICGHLKFDLESQQYLCHETREFIVLMAPHSHLSVLVGLTPASRHPGDESNVFARRLRMERHGQPARYPRIPAALLQDEVQVALRAPQFLSLEKGLSWNLFLISIKELEFENCSTKYKKNNV